MGQHRAAADIECWASSVKGTHSAGVAMFINKQSVSRAVSVEGSECQGHECQGNAFDEEIECNEAARQLLHQPCRKVHGFHPSDNRPFLLTGLTQQLTYLLPGLVVFSLIFYYSLHTETQTLQKQNLTRADISVTLAGVHSRGVLNVLLSIGVPSGKS
eukprot:1161621-Pelagomonas_calceolata.AAC.5